ncbi:hypothetical protein VNI00_007361 [Paramarasmius palmivorus]|uniref:AAA protein C-terminal winged helix domain-containing protein n=1 Tax=Paramarasmius palmivorus TaxID=297713 RepID=A0AAW0D4W6_9AGAR
MNARFASHRIALGLSRNTATAGQITSPKRHINIPNQNRRESTWTNPPPSSDGARKGNGDTSNLSEKLPSRSLLLDTALATVVWLGIALTGGYVYVQWYKKNVLNKIELAFAPGYDPALEVARNHLLESQSLPEDEDEEAPEPWTRHFRRAEQDLIDRIVRGELHGNYFVLLGPKGCGKGTMIFDSMHAVLADGIAVCQAHPDLEVFRLRLGKALNFQFNEDSQTGLFQRKDPREGGPELDIERAMNKLEKVALRCVKRRAKPLVLIINNVHLFDNDGNGHRVLLQLQQRAENWATSGILTIVFTMDDFWPFHVMRKNANKMHVVSIFDLSGVDAAKALTTMRTETKPGMIDASEVKEAVSIIGGRMSYLNKLSRSRSMKDTANRLLDLEKAWLLSQIGLIANFDNDVVDEQKRSFSSWLLLQEFVKLRQEQERVHQDIDPSELPLPSIPYLECGQIMNRADCLEELDRKNIISIDEKHNVRPDSLLLLNAARQVVEAENFQEQLDSVRARIEQVQGSSRVRELIFKGLNNGKEMRLGRQ